MSEHIYRQFVADLAANGQRPKAELRSDIIGYVHHGYAQGEPWATEVLARWEAAGADADYTAAHKALHSVTYIRGDGRRVRKTTGYSRPIRSAESSEIIGYQMQSWWDMDLNQLVLLEADLERQHEQLNDSRAAVRAAREALQRHPECGTAREAWLAEGRSLAEIDVDLA